MEFAILAGVFGGLMVILTLIAIFKPETKNSKTKSGEPENLAKDVQQLYDKNRKLRSENTALRKELDRLKKDSYTKPRNTTESEGKVVKGKP